MSGSFRQSACLASLAILACVPVWASPDGIEAVTYPSDDVIMSFVSPGRIASVEVKVGDSVAPRTVLVRQDDSVEQAELEQLAAQARETVHIRAAEAQLAQKRVDCEKIKQAFEGGAATELEVRHAELEVIVAELSVEKVKFQQLQDQRRYERAQLSLDRMRIVSPIPGVVEHIFKHAGESADTLKEVIRVVRIDPLWIDVPAPRDVAERLGLAQEVQVVLSAGRGEGLTGRIIHKAAVADAASDTLMVRVELANPDARPAGEHVRVFFTGVDNVNPAPAQPDAAVASNTCERTVSNDR